ncbi:MAG: hypothetical protein EOP83_27935, partial [Verrucomicrobiaceae bacterium]
MSKKTQLAEMMRRKNALQAQLKNLKEAQSKTGLAFLIESELEKAEVVLAAKSIVDKLQKIAEDLAKVNGDEIMPIMEPLKAAFGPQMAEQFQSIVSEKINATVAAVSQAKDAISSEVGKFEGIMNGETPGNDMSAMGGDPAAAAPAMGADAMGMDAAAAPAPEIAPEMGAAVAPEAAVGPDAGMDDAFGADPTTAAGRAKKESAAPRGKAIKEGEFVKGKKGVNPFAPKDADSDENEAEDKEEKKDDKEEVSESDARILKLFRKAIREGAKPVPAAKTIARHFGIDFSD